MQTTLKIFINVYSVKDEIIFDGYQWCFWNLSMTKFQLFKIIKAPRQYIIEFYDNTFYNYCIGQV